MAFAYYSPITVNSGQVPSTQTDFPMAVWYTAARLKTVGNGGHVQNANGYDIRPYDGIGGSALTYELQKFDATTGELIMWVKVPSLADSLVIYLYYGDAALTTDGSSSSTWDSGYKAVYHLPNGTTLTANDSTSNANHGSLSTPPPTAGSFIGGGANFVASSSEYINCGTASSLQITGDLTLSCWFYSADIDAIHVGNQQLIAKDKDTGGRAYNIDINYFNDHLRFYINGASGGNVITGSTTLVNATVYQVVGVYHATGTLDLYLNGASDATQVTGASTSINSATADVLIGGRQYSGFEDYFHGLIDEVRISNVARTANWVATNYNNLSAPGVFATLGSESGSTPPTGDTSSFLSF